MSDVLQHECGIALVRLRKPLDYYIKKYGSPLYPMNKLYILMAKQINRGQDGAGVANIKIDRPPGKRYISRYRSVEARPVVDIFKKINERFTRIAKEDPERLKDADWLKENTAFTGEVWLGHLRDGATGKNDIENCQPMLRQNNWRSRNLVLAGNFNMTNANELFQKLIDLGQHPKDKVDAITVLEKIGHFLDEGSQRTFDRYKETHQNPELSHVIEENLDLQKVLVRACRDFDGGYAIAGITGYGASFVVRDPAGIRPAYYWYDDEFVVVASERVAIKAAFNPPFNEMKEITPGHALIINKAGDFAEHEILKPLPKKSCSFERIYFSRGADPEIYSERKTLGKMLIPHILEEVDHDLENTVFTYIPNTAEMAFYGMVEGIEEYLVDWRKSKIEQGNLSPEELQKVLQLKPRFEKLASKDVKLRTFIAGSDDRTNMVASVYEMTYGIINSYVDNLVIIDDSIVRGTTLEKSILRLLDRLKPKKIVVASSAPQIRYPDCYGIDMSNLEDFIAFRAMTELLKDHGLAHREVEVYNEIKKLQSEGRIKERNVVKDLYKHFTFQEISNKTSEILAPDDIYAEVSVIYQTIEGLHEACKNHIGDWYFTGNYPTPGGNKIANTTFLKYMEAKQSASI